MPTGLKISGPPGQVIRGDGNFKLAKRVCVRLWGRRFPLRPYTVVLAWTGTDGSLLQPVALKRGETLNCIVEDLAPLLDSIKAARLAEGLPPEACAPAFHATDNFRSQRNRLCALYRQKWPELHTRALARTPLGDAAGSADVGSCPTCITGDPRHDVIALRKLVPPTCNDWRDCIADHTDALNRLSAPLPPAPTLGALPSPPSLAARRLLRFGVEQPATAFGQEISRRPRAARELRQLLGSAGALRSPVWQEEFQAIPPRGALERLAKRLGGTLHPDNGFHNFLDQSGFKKEIRRLRKWYKAGRRLTRARRGMIRSDAAPAQVRGVRSVFNAKVRTHYRRLLQSARLEGLFAWRDAAVAIRAAGVAVQSGTVSVERVWSSLLDMFPDQARNISPEWFALCSKVAFLRFNYRHFHAGRSPPWCDGDPLMAERLDHLAAQLRLMADEGPDDGAEGAMAALYRPFS